MVRCFQKDDINNLSWSEIILSGRPFSQYQWSKKRTASSLALRVVEVGIILISEFSLSVMVSIQSCPWSLGRGPIKSIDMESQHLSGTGNGWSGPEAFLVLDLLHWQSGQEGI